MKYVQIHNQRLIKLATFIVAGVVMSISALSVCDAADQDQTDSTMIRKLLEFHTKLAKQGNLESIVKLGTMYEKGEGVTKDRNKAIKLYKLAADQGYKPAQKMLANILANKPNVSKRTYTMDTIRVPRQRTRPPEKDADALREKEYLLRMEREKAAAAREELDKLRQSQLEEQEKQRHLQQEVERVRKAQEALAQERAKAEAARRELEQLRKQQEDALRKQQELTQKQLPAKPAQPQQPQKQEAQKKKTEEPSFSSDPCKTPAAKFMSTCN
jgi:TPR repeat protein